MDAFLTNGAISWVELMTGNPAEAAEFYEAVFGWKYQTTEMATGPYTSILVGDKQIGGIFAKPPESAEVPTHWGVYVTVHDIDAVAEAVAAAGGQIIVPIFHVPTVGRIMVLNDPTGGTISAIQYEMPEPDSES